MDWEVVNNQLYKKYKFKDFPSAIHFMSMAAPEIDHLNHHPVWQNTYNSVEVWLCTHDAGNTITPKDHELAAVLDRVYGGI